jgi:hypothetical protein
MASRKRRQGSTTRTPARVPPAESSGDGRIMRLAKQGTILLGLVSGTVGLLFLLIPGIRPGQGAPTADQSASITGVVVNPRTTKGQFLDYSDQSKLGFTRAQLATVGASVFARVEIVGYRGKTLTLERQIVNATTGDVVDGRTRDFKVTPPAEKVTHRWWDWAALRAGSGSYVMVLKVIDERGLSAIACGESELFYGLAGPATASSTALPKLCEGGG